MTFTLPASLRQTALRNQKAVYNILFRTSAAALQKLAEEDPTFKIRTEEETGQTLIWGMGELHLEIIVDRLLREFKVGANVGKPQVAYKETITKSVTGEGRFIRQTGGKGQYGHVVIQIGRLTIRIRLNDLSETYSLPGI